MAYVTVNIKQETALLISKAKAKLLNDFPTEKITSDYALTIALKHFLGVKK